MLLGTIEHLCIRWHLLGGPSNLVDQVDPLVEIVLQGIRNPSRPGVLPEGTAGDERNSG
jgi:hypothetical protein